MKPKVLKERLEPAVSGQRPAAIDSLLFPLPAPPSHLFRRMECGEIPRQYALL
jgi:hypothetical protein